VGRLLIVLLPSHPMITLSRTIDLLDTTKPTAGKAIEALLKVGVLGEITGKKRDRVYAYQSYLDILSADFDILSADFDILSAENVSAMP
jgi:hypothetical protein